MMLIFYKKKKTINIILILFEKLEKYAKIINNHNNLIFLLCFNMQFFKFFFTIPNEVHTSIIHLRNS